MSPAKLWWWSRRAHLRKLKFVSRILKTINFFVFKAILPPEAEFHPDIQLEHYGLGIVIHPNVTIGRRTIVYHQVTIAAETWVGSPYRVVVGDDVVIGAGAIIVARPDTGLTIGDGARIGAGAVVTKDVPPGATVAGVPARVIGVSAARDAAAPPPAVREDAVSSSPEEESTPSSAPLG